MSETIKLKYKVKLLYKGKEHDLQELFEYLSEEIYKKDNIIKEVREYIEEHKNNLLNTFDEDVVFGEVIKPILEILDKVGKDNE